LDTPLLSVVMCTCNRPRQLAEFLAFMAVQTMDRADFELVIVDDGSTPPVAPVLEPFLAQLSLRPFRQANAGVARARNAGVRRARGRFVAFVDDDNQPPPDWLEKLAARCRRDGDALIGGRTLNALASNPYARASQLILDAAYRWHNDGPAGPRFFHGGNMAVAREAFLEVGGFDPRYGRAGAEDRGFCACWAAGGGRLVYAPEIVVFHAHHLGLRTFWKQHRGCGRGAWLFLRLHRERLAPVPLGRQLAFYRLLLAAPFSAPHRGWDSFPLLVLLLLSRLANFAGYYAEALRPQEQVPAGERDAP